MVMVPTLAPIQPHGSLDISTSAVIENLTPDSLLHMPVVFADENDDENVINDVSLASYQP